MFEWLKPKKNQRSSYPLFLGDLAVVPRSDIRRFLEIDWGGEETDMALKRFVSETLELPLLQESVEKVRKHLIIDVLLSQYRIGVSDELELEEYVFFLIWRPFVRLHFRLRDGQSNKVIGNFLVKKKMPWGEYLGKVFSWRGVFGFGGVFKEEDMHKLLLASLLEGMKWARQQANT